MLFEYGLFISDILVRECYYQHGPLISEGFRTNTVSIPIVVTLNKELYFRLSQN